MYSLLYVRSAIDDLTARARIRDAAIDAFAATGFDATVRQIAARARVSVFLRRGYRLTAKSTAGRQELPLQHALWEGAS